ncbi:Crp/Fnr family transcriptional regulator [Helicobacter sp. 23-1044]
MEDYIAKLSKIGKIRRYKVDNILFFEGEMPRKLTLLLSGKVRLEKAFGDRQKVLHTLKSPCFIAEYPAFAEKSYPASAICASECEILEIDLATFRAHSAESSAFCFELIASLCQKIGILERYITQNTSSLTQNLAHFLLENSANLPSQRKIAEILGTNPQSLSRIIKSLKEMGIITTHKGKIVVLDSAKLGNF